MKSLLPASGLVVVSLLLAGCSATPHPADARTVTVTVTAAPPTPTLGAAEAAPWDLHAVCAAESEISTLETWRDDQAAASRLTAAQAKAITQGIAVQYLDMDQFGVPTSVQQEVAALAAASGTLEHPALDLDSTRVRTARTGLTQTCADNGLTIGVYAQGG